MKFPEYPAFLHEINNFDEFITVQRELLSKGYQWGSGRGDKIWYPNNNNIVCYPVYISNSPSPEYQDYSRISKKYFYWDYDVNMFDVKMARKIKLKKLNLL